MADYCLSCCSTVDLTPEQMKARDIRYVCFHFTLDGTEYADDMGVSLSSEELFRRMSAGAQTKTSQVSVAEYLAHFESMRREGKDILHVTLSTGLTGTYNAACAAKSMLEESYPQQKIYIVEQMAAHAENGTQYSGKCYLCHSLCLEDAKAVAALVEEQFPNLNGSVRIYPIGTTIGSHTGPGTVALFFWGDERKD